jgi:TatA/E family protein of Tat protein translocase
MNGMLLFLNISGGEILLILVVVYLVFGPKKIPELARMLGKGINEMRRATKDIKDEINREISKTTKDINLDIDRGDPLGIKKKMEEAMDDSTKRDPENQTDVSSEKTAQSTDPTPTQKNKSAVKGTVEKKTGPTEKKPDQEAPRNEKAPA